MADDQIQRPYRVNVTPARGAAGVAATGSDPLAELARLIGQTDPFAEFGRENARRPAPAPAVAPTAPSFGPADYFDAPSALPPRPAPLQPPPAYAPPSGAARQPYAPAGAFPPPGAPAGMATDPYHQGHAEHASDDAEYYENLPQPKRRIGVIAIAVVFALVVIGAAGAFGYRTMFGGSQSSAPPPVIKADTAPVKVLPAAASKTPSKLITDRVGEQAAGEKLVSREEKPVAVPAPQGNGQVPAAMPAPGAGVISTEPKKVHTIVIHPDQMGDGQQPPVAAAAPPAPARTAPPPVASNPPPAVNAAPPPARPVEARTAAPAQGTAAVRGNAPLSLNPDAPATRATRTAAVAAPQPAPAPVAQVTPSGGGYAVQVSSQRSEADAQAAFRNLQAKYPNVLGGKQAVIHKVELGAKGTYYRAMVGPFANANEATDLCNGLKAAGGQCLIQRN